MNRRYVLTDKEILTPEAIRAIQAKELLIKASQSGEPPTGNLITAIGNRAYAFVCIAHHASDSAQQYFDEDDSLLTMLASEDVLRDEWDTPEEDEAWANLLKVK